MGGEHLVQERGAGTGEAHQEHRRPGIGREGRQIREQRLESRRHPLRRRGTVGPFRDGRGERLPQRRLGGEILGPGALGLAQLVEHGTQASGGERAVALRERLLEQALQSRRRLLLAPGAGVELGPGELRHRIGGIRLERGLGPALRFLQPVLLLAQGS